MRRYLSFGGGVNSVALMLMLADQGIECEAVFADHGADWPETYEYVEMLQARGYAIMRLDVGNLHAECAKYAIMPSRWQRWCTRQFKVEPLNRYFVKPATVYLGIDYGEQHRAKPSRQEGLTHEYPLVDEGMDRAACVRYIERHGLPVPIKSGCYFCPFQRLSQWRELYTKHPDLFCKAKRLEQLASERVGKPIYLSNAEKPLEVVAMTSQPDLFGERGLTPCLCEL